MEQDGVDPQVPVTLRSEISGALCQLCHCSCLQPVHTSWQQACTIVATTAPTTSCSWLLSGNLMSRFFDNACCGEKLGWQGEAGCEWPVWPGEEGTLEIVADACPKSKPSPRLSLRLRQQKESAPFLPPARLSLPILSFLPHCTCRASSFLARGNNILRSSRVGKKDLGGWQISRLQTPFQEGKARSATSLGLALLDSTRLDCRCNSSSTSKSYLPLLQLQFTSSLVACTSTTSPANTPLPSDIALQRTTSYMTVR
jgi:hypothetical protein